MIFKNYEYFLTIAQEGSISKAAERLFISQPSLSKYLKRLEENVGMELFNRGSYPLHMTEAGEMYLAYIKEIMQKEKRLLWDFANLQDRDAGCVSIGITVWRSSIILPIALPLLQKRYPKITVKVHEGSHQFMASLLEHDKVDFSVFHLPNNYHNVIFEHLQYERILFCVNEKHPVLSELGIKNTDDIIVMHNQDFMRFSDEPFIHLKPGQNIRDITQNYLGKLGILPRIVLETSNIVTAVNMARAGMGVTFVPEAVLHIPEQSQGLVFFQVDEPPLQWEVGIAYRNGNPPARLARLLIDCIRESFGSI